MRCLHSALLRWNRGRSCVSNAPGLALQPQGRTQRVRAALHITCAALTLHSCVERGRICVSRCKTAAPQSQGRTQRVRSALHMRCLHSALPCEHRQELCEQIQDGSSRAAG
eukprot:1156717-Pelagomonas_calceolata.AAC.9